jgi:hypothetical protein
MGVAQQLGSATFSRVRRARRKAERQSAPDDRDDRRAFDRSKDRDQQRRCSSEEREREVGHQPTIADRGCRRIRADAARRRPQRRRRMLRATIGCLADCRRAARSRSCSLPLSRSSDRVACLQPLKATPFRVGRAPARRRLYRRVERNAASASQRRAARSAACPTRRRHSPRRLATVSSSYSSFTRSASRDARSFGVS